MQNNTIRTIYISFLFLFLFIVYCQFDRAEASIRKDGFYPPRVQQVCWDNFYGVSFNWADKNPKFAKRCEVLWRLWVEEEKAKFKN